MNLNDLKETKTFDETYIPHEQKVMGEYLVQQGYQTYIEGPYMCSYHKKQYCYIWAVGNLSGTNIKKIDGRGYNIR